MVSNHTLSKIVVAGGVAVISARFYVGRKLVERIKEGEHYKIAIQTLMNHRGAAHLLGEPISEGKIDLANSSNFNDGNKAHFSIGVNGTIKSGIYYYWAERQDKIWNVTKAELELSDDSSRRLIIVKQNSPNEINQSLTC